MRFPKQDPLKNIYIYVKKSTIFSPPIRPPHLELLVVELLSLLHPLPALPLLQRGGLGLLGHLLVADDLPDVVAALAGALAVVVVVVVALATATALAVLRTGTCAETIK